MKGTEKQIAWATGLIEKMEKEFDEYLNCFPEDQKESGRKVMDKIITLAKEAYAGDVIELLKDNNKEADKYYRSFFTTLKISANPLVMQIKKDVFSKLH